MIARADVEASVAITTQNRCRDLAIALRSCEKLKARVEVLVVDDCSADGTQDLVASEFPQVRYIRNSSPRGYIYGRNLAAAEASSNFIFSIDDDAAFADTNTVSDALELFEDPSVGALALPYINVGIGGELTTPPVDSVPRAVYAFVGTAHAIRKDVFLAVGGYDVNYFHQGEEIDLCLRLRAVGFHTRLAATAPIYHYTSPSRDIGRIHTYGLRNALLTGWRNVPSAGLVPFWARALAQAFIGATKDNQLRCAGRGLHLGVIAIVHHRSQRHPMSRELWRLSRKLRASGPLPIMTLPLKDAVGIPQAPYQGKGET